MKKVFLSLFIVSTLLLPHAVAAQAQSQDTCSKLDGQFQKYGGGGLFGSFRYCSTGEVIAKIVSIALTLIGAITVVGVIYGGILYITSGGNEAAAKKGKQVAFYSVLGLVVVVMASLLVTIITRVVVDNTLF
jgi:hypothetical protein